MRWISRKWKNLSWFILFPKNKKYACLPYIYMYIHVFISTKWKKWSNSSISLHFRFFSLLSVKYSFDFHLIFQFLWFARSARNLTDFLCFFIYIYICSHFHNVEKLDWFSLYFYIFLFISAIRFTFRKCMIYIQKVKKREKNIYVSLFLRSGKNKTNNSGISLYIWFYFHEL